MSRQEADCEPLQLSEIELQVPTAKRRKYTGRRQSQSLMPGTISSAKSLSQVSEYGANTKQKCNRPPASTVTAPPDVLQRRKKSESTFNPSIKMKLNSQYQNAVTKFSRPKDKDSMREFRTQSLIQHKQVTTTEQQLNLSKSTLEKLSTFVYKPQASNQSATIDITTLDDRSKKGYLSSSYQVHHNRSCLSSCDITPYNYDNVTHEMVESSSLEGDPNTLNTLSTGNEPHREEQAEDKGSQANGLPAEVDREIPNFPPAAFHCDVQFQSRRFDCLPERSTGLVANEFPNLTVDVANNTLLHPAVDTEESADVSDYEAILIPSAPPSAAKDTIESLGAPDHPVPAPNCRISDLGRPYCSVNLKQLDPDGFKVVNDIVLNGPCAKDTFDEGLDDVDLLEIALTPENRKMQLKKLNYSANRSQILDIFEVAGDTDRSSHMNDYPMLMSNESRNENATCDYSASNTALSDPDDEYGMDEEYEEEFLKLAQLTESTEVIMATKRFAPSTSVQDAIYIGSDHDEVYDSALQFSPPEFRTQSGSPDLSRSNYTDPGSKSAKGTADLEPPPGTDDEDWSFVRSRQLVLLSNQGCVSTYTREQIPTRLNFSDSTTLMLDDNHEYEEVKPFARPAFPNLILDRSPIVGLSSKSFLRVCFRIGEMYKEGGRCNSLGTDAIIELFARVGFSSREPGTVKQHFQFLDIWHDRPPIVAGILANYRTTKLAETESRSFLDGRGEKMARCLGRLKRDARSPTGWLLHIINIRETDWEEIRWTRRIVSGGHSTSRKENSTLKNIRPES
jgi:ribosomal protein L17